MNKLMTTLATLGVGATIATTAMAQGECWWVGCNPEAPLCRVQCGSDNVLSQWQVPYAGAYYPQRSFNRHAKRHHKTGHPSG
jgi:hypothetical protein